MSFAIFSLSIKCVHIYIYTYICIYIYIYDWTFYSFRNACRDPAQRYDEQKSSYHVLSIDF